MSTCRYTYHSDYQGINFSCNEESRTKDDSYCIFHDKDHASDSRIEAIEKFHTKVLESISRQKPLECIGYFLPHFKFAELITDNEFSQPLFFNNATFYEEADFSRVRFLSIVDFSNATFFKGANFYEFSNKSKGIEYTFPGQRKFYGSAVSFIEVNFLGTAVYNHAKFESGVNFSAAEFHNKVNFFETHFYKLAIFYGVKFLQNEVNFQQSKFLEGEAADFRAAEFDSLARFTNVHFSEGVDFTDSKFLSEVRFNYLTEFDKETKFRGTLFEKPERVFIDVMDLSFVSFLNTDLRKINFGGNIKWGTKNRFTIYDEREIELTISDQNRFPKIDLNSVLSVYRNLRENYEYRRRYDEAGQFFIREMELKRHYREREERENNKLNDNNSEQKAHLTLIKNSWWRRNIFSLTACYFHLSRYGEDLLRPTLAGIVILFLSTMFFVMQSNPTVEPSIFHFADSSQRGNYSLFVGVDQIGESFHWLKAFERSMADFLPLLPMGNTVKIGLIDYIIKIVGGAITFGLVAIALRRRFERKYTH
jgi:uncharacterized protein YjbI with pentapeptide repeats